MTCPAVVRSLILGCAGELDAVTFAGVVATARIRPSVCQYSAIMSWARDNHGARIAVDLYGSNREGGERLRTQTNRYVPARGCPRNRVADRLRLESASIRRCSPLLSSTAGGGAATGRGGGDRPVAGGRQAEQAKRQDGDAGQEHHPGDRQVDLGMLMRRRGSPVL